MKRKLLTAFLLACSLLTGCGEKDKKERAEVHVNEYEKITYETVPVERGDIVPTLALDLVSDDYERKNYYPAKDELVVEKVYVKEGDYVEKGDLLVSFKSGDIEEQIKNYENSLEERELLIEHYSNLMEIDTSLDYTSEIEMLKSDAEVDRLYIQELQLKLESYNIKAEANGTVIIVSDSLDYGVVYQSDNILSVVYGSGYYYGETEEEYDFVVGNIYEGTYATSTYSLKLVNVEEETDENGIPLKKLTVSMAVEGVTGSSSISMVLDKPTLENVLYVPKDAIFSVEEKTYVYTLDENGFREAVEVKVGPTVNGYTVIEDGLTEEDKVVID